MDELRFDFIPAPEILRRTWVLIPESGECPGGFVGRRGEREMLLPRYSEALAWLEDNVGKVSSKRWYLSNQFIIIVGEVERCAFRLRWC